MLRTLLSGLPVIQVAVVVRDLEACSERQNASLGNGPWRVCDLGPHVIDRYVLRGEPATGHTLVALNDAHRGAAPRRSGSLDEPTRRL